MKHIIQVPSNDNMYYCGTDQAEFRKYAYDQNKALVFPTFDEAKDEAVRLNEISSHTFKAITVKPTNEREIPVILTTSPGIEPAYSPNYKRNS